MEKTVQEVGDGMKTLKLDRDTNDLIINSNNKLAMVEDEEEVEQSIKVLLGTNKGEWFLNLFHGLAYEYIFVKSPDFDRIRAEILLALDQEPRIVSVEAVEFDFEREHRKLNIRLVLLIESGEVITIEEVI